MDRHAREARPARRPDRTPAAAGLFAWFAQGRGRWPVLAGLALLCALLAMAVLSPGRDDGAVASFEEDGAAPGASPDSERNAVAGAAPACNGLLEHSAWTGRVAFANSRDVRHGRLDQHVAYDQKVDVHAALPEHTRREHRGSDVSVRYANPAPQGQVDFTYVETDGEMRRAFKADGGMRPHEDGMSGGGSMLAIIVKADCSYELSFYAHATGTWTETGYRGTPTISEGAMPLIAVAGYGTVDATGAVRGSGDFKAWPDPLMGDRAPEGTDMVTEYSTVFRALGYDMGTVHVEWDFQPVR